MAIITGSRAQKFYSSLILPRLSVSDAVGHIYRYIVKHKGQR